MKALEVIGVTSVLVHGAAAAAAARRLFSCRRTERCARPRWTIHNYNSSSTSHSGSITSCAVDGRGSSVRSFTDCLSVYEWSALSQRVEQ